MHWILNEYDHEVLRMCAAMLAENTRLTPMFERYFMDLIKACKEGIGADDVQWQALIQEVGEEEGITV